MRLILISVVALTLSAQSVNAQGCCSGGGGNPLAGGASTGVLQEGQMEVIGSYQYSRSNKFLTRDSDTMSFFDNLTSNYIFLKADYGITDKLTFSVASGYYVNRTITEFPDTSYVGGEMEIEQVKVKSGGIGDLIIFPRYSVFNKSKGVNRTELTLGLGWKIPLGSHRDSNFVGYSKFVNFDNNPPTIDSTEIWQTSPPTVQATNGSHDLMAYGFFFKSFPHRKFRVFASALYVRRGWNSLGLKFGDYGSLGIYAGTTVFKSLGLTGQVQGEWVGKMRVHDQIDPLSLYSIDTASTGSFKLSFVPQVSYTFKGGVTLFALADIPLYQYMNGTQVASQYQITGGLSYRFFVKKKKKDSNAKPIEEPPVAVVSTDNKITSFRVWGKCEMCKDKIEKTLKGMDGIVTANWNVETHMLTVGFDNAEVTTEDMKKSLAKVGYDTEEFRASDKAYKKLHSCCKYERP